MTLFSAYYGTGLTSSLALPQCDKQKTQDTVMYQYIKKWAKQIAWEIYNENQNEFRLKLHDNIGGIRFLSYDKITSVIMESIWRNK